MARNSPKNRAERAETERIVSWNRESLTARIGSFQDDVASNLVHFGLLPMSTENVSEMLSGNIARKLHATDRVSSRTRCKRIISGIC